MINPASLIDHTLLSPTATETQIATLCEEAVEFGFASVCVPPCYVSRSAEYLYGSEVKVCSVVGFPCGYATTLSKINETGELVASGAEEIDMVLQIGCLLEGRYQQVEDEIRQVVVEASQVPVKVIIECAWLNSEQKTTATNLVVNAGAAFVKTSTGFGPSGAICDDVRLLSETSAGQIGVKAAGGIRSLADCLSFVSCGATRIGSSSGVAIMKQWQEKVAGAE